MTPNPDTAAEDATREAVEGFSDWTEDDLDPDEGDSGSATRGGSGGTYLTDLDDTLRGAGLTVKEEDGWKKRSNDKGGYSGNGPVGIIIHHTGGGKGADGQGDVNFILNYPKARPVSNLYLDRKGTWWVLAAGGTNTNGRGGPWGPIDYYTANNRVIGIEGGNKGDGERWPEVMQASYVKGVAALADRYGIDGNNILSHYEWRTADNRPDKVWDKHDPAGPSRFGSINRLGTWDMNKFRAEVNEARRNRSNVKAVQTKSADDNMYVIQPGDAWWSIAEKTLGNAKATWKSLAEANGGQGRVLIPGQVLTIPGKGSAGAAAKASGGSTAAFPGEAKRGMTGPVVVAWQEALIAHGTIANTKDNRDGDYGEGMEKAVLELQQSWDWSDADGIAGPGTWKKLHSVGG